MRIKSMILASFGFCTLVMGAVPDLMNQSDLRSSWIKNNPNYKVEFTADKCTATCLKNERRSLAVQSRNVTRINPGEHYYVTFQARGSVKNLDFVPQFNGNNDKTQQKNFRITDEWDEYETTFEVPADGKRFSCAIYAWNQEGTFEIRKFSVKRYTGEKPVNPVLMTQGDLRMSWNKGNPNYKVEFGADKCTATCLKNERKTLAVQSRQNTKFQTGKTYKVAFLTRGTVRNLEFVPQFDGQPGKDQQKSFRITGDWEDAEATFEIPAGCKKFSCAIYAWNQEGFFDIKDFSITLNEALNGESDEK